MSTPLQQTINLSLRAVACAAIGRRCLKGRRSDIEKNAFEIRDDSVVEVDAQVRGNVLVLPSSSAAASSSSAADEECTVIYSNGQNALLTLRMLGGTAYGIINRDCTADHFGELPPRICDRRRANIHPRDHHDRSRLVRGGLCR